MCFSTRFLESTDPTPKKLRRQRPKFQSSPDELGRRTQRGRTAIGSNQPVRRRIENNRKCGTANDANSTQHARGRNANEHRKRETMGGSGKGKDKPGNDREHPGTPDSY